MREYNFGHFLYILRSDAGLTQFQLGKLVGVSDKAVSKWENGVSKPQRDILYKLSEVLGVSIDELLSCKYHSCENENVKGVFATRKQLWSKALDAMHNRYSEFVPIEILNRFLSEKADIENTDMIVYFDFLSALVSEAKKNGEHIRIKGGVASSFVAYLMGATEVNPLKPHYYCPDCKRVIFDDRVKSGWDLPSINCSCSKTMRSDGHGIPFEVYHSDIQRNIALAVDVSPEFLLSAKKCAEEYFKECKIKTEERDGHICMITVTTQKSEQRILFFADDELAHYKLLEERTATSFDRVRFDTADILREFQKGNTDGITEFKSTFTKNMLEKVSPSLFNDLIQISGLSHAVGGWRDNAEALIQQGFSIGETIAYRDDVFNYVRKRMISKGFTDTGFAYKVMEDTRRGVYSKNGIPDEVEHHLRAVGTEDWFVDSVGKIGYLFQKAHGISYVRTAVILMWYKLHYPKEFNEIMML
ncbi:MAG: helix-turn-helix domain-containing protein [Clostridia bacterium]|nr:helix-turn-helix domain-containing protein [Clostridia bacterium]